MAKFVHMSDWGKTGALARIHQIQHGLKFDPSKMTEGPQPRGDCLYAAPFTDGQFASKWHRYCYLEDPEKLGAGMISFDVDLSRVFILDSKEQYLAAFEKWRARGWLGRLDTRRILEETGMAGVYFTDDLVDCLFNEETMLVKDGRPVFVDDLQHLTVGQLILADLSAIDPDSVCDITANYGLVLSDRETPKPPSKKHMTLAECRKYKAENSWLNETAEELYKTEVRNVTDNIERYNRIRDEIERWASMPAM